MTYLSASPVEYMRGTAIEDVRRSVGHSGRFFLYLEKSGNYAMKRHQTRHAVSGVLSDLRAPESIWGYLLKLYLLTYF